PARRAAPWPGTARRSGERTSRAPAPPRRRYCSVSFFSFPATANRRAQLYPKHRAGFADVADSQAKQRLPRILAEPTFICNLTNLRRLMVHLSIAPLCYQQPKGKPSSGNRQTDKVRCPMPRYQPADSLASPRFTGVRTFARLPHVQTTEEVD